MNRDGADARRQRLSSVFDQHHHRLFRYAAYLVDRFGIGAAQGADDLLAEVALVTCEKALESDTSLPSDPQAMVE